MSDATQDWQTRRRFLKTTALTGVLSGTAVGQAAAQNSSSHTLVDVTHGTSVGEVRADSAVVWARTAGNAYLHIEVATDSGFSDRRQAQPVEVVEADDYTGQVRVGDLSSNTEYYYRVWATKEEQAGLTSAGVSSDAYVQGEFVTAPAGDEAAAVSFAWSGDSYGFGEDPIEPPFTSFKHIAESNPDFFLYLGDTIYADAKTPAGRIKDSTSPGKGALNTYWGKYKEVRNPPESIASKSYLDDVLQSTSVYAIWDDHEVENNFAGSVNDLMPTGRKAFFDYWPLDRDPTTDDETRLYGSFRWGKHVELFIIDTRQYRDPNKDVENKTLLGENQLSWLKDALRSSDATFKVIANPAPFGFPTDSWYNLASGMGYEAELKELMTFITSEDIDNVVSLAGDIHRPYISSYDPDGDGAIDIVEAAGGPIGAPGNAPMDQFTGALNPTHFWGAEGHVLNYGTVEIPADGESLTISQFDDSGQKLYEQTFRAGDKTGFTVDTTDSDGNEDLTRLVTTAKGAEITGIDITPTGKFFLNVQHPNSDNQNAKNVDGNISPWSPREYNRGAVGAVIGTNIEDIPQEFEEVPEKPGGIFDEQVNTAFGEHQVLANGGDTEIDGVTVKNGQQLGVPYSPDDTPMTDANNPDFNGFIPTNDDDTEGFLFTDWESVPGMITRMKVTYDGGMDPSWTVESAHNLDLREIGGTWVNCFGSVSPWNTPLSSEEYEPDAKQWLTEGGDGYDAMTTYLGEPANPYRYGYVVEVRNPTADDPVPEKRLAMGRKSNECSMVMPDKKTVYFGDDGSYCTFFKFVADEAGDLSSGTLYAAKLTQDDTSDPAEAGFDIQWIELAHGSDDEIESWIAEYDGQQPGSDTDYITETEIKEWANGNADDDRVAFLESRKAAEALGATAEWQKMEGVQISNDATAGDFLYMGVSTISNGMTDQKGDMQLDENGYGAIYRMRLDSEYNVSRIEPAVLGSEETFHNPDNILVMNDGRVLIGEDTGRANDMLWVYQPGTQVEVSSVAVGQGSTGTVELTLSDAPNGFAGGSLTVSLSNSEVAKITDASYGEDLALTKPPEISDDGTSVTLQASDLDKAVQDGATDITLATIELEGTATGTADITIDLNRLDDDDGNRIEAITRQGVVITGPPAIGDRPAPTDPDSDGLYEDVNGNGRMDYDDVVLLFDNFEADAVRLNKAAYDFNENGKLDFDDTVELYEEIN